MADVVVTDPLVLDETLRTTDGNDTNLADLMQSGLLNIANALGNLPSYTAGNITYDNSTSELEATNVKDALDELASEKADASDVYTKTETDAKIEALDYSDTAVNGSYVKAVSETDGVIAVTREAADATPTENSQKMVTSGGVYGEISALNDALTQRMTYADNGVLGAKNLLPMVLSDIKSLNNGGTWSDNVYTLNGVDFIVNTDDNGNVTSIVVNGTASAQTGFNLASNYTRINAFLEDGITYTMSGCPSGSSSSTCWLIYSNNINAAKSDFGDGVNITLYPSTFPNQTIQILVISGVTVPSKTFYPMIRLATDTDDTFQPYAKTNLQLTNDVSAINTGLANINSALSTYETGTLTIEEAYSEIVTSNNLRYIKRNDGTTIIYGSFVLGSGISSSTLSQIFSGLSLSQYPTWVTMLEHLTNASYRMLCRSNGLYEYYTAYPAGEYYVSPFVAFS